jgi:DNA-binding transcriptional activator of the SARP family
MQFVVLGPVELVTDRRVAPAGSKERRLLSVLLINADAVVPRHRLVDELWEGAPPSTAVNLVHQYVARLRRKLHDADPDRTGPDPTTGRLVTRGHGYLLRVRPGELDATRFDSMLARAQDAMIARQPLCAATILGQALDLWRGPAFADVAPTATIAAATRRLEERRLTALELRADADLLLGRHANLVGELTELVAHHPLRERLRAQLMLALYRSDRQADALAVYQIGRRLLAETLGLEPGARLQRLERDILRREPYLDHTV